MSSPYFDATIGQLNNSGGSFHTQPSYRAYLSQGLLMFSLSASIVSCISPLNSLEPTEEDASLSGGVEESDPAGREGKVDMEVTAGGREAGAESTAGAGSEAGAEITAGETTAGAGAGAESTAGAGAESTAGAGIEAGVEVTSGAGVEAGTEAGGEMHTGGERIELTACDPPLEITPSVTASLPYDLVLFRASGGTGSYQFSMVESQSGGIINEDTGAYLAGAALGTQDRVRLIDLGCIGQIESVVDVVNPMKISPRAPNIGRGQRFTFQIVEGSGEFSFSWIENLSGGELTAEGEYISGDVIAEDRIEIVDLQTGESLIVVVSVVQQTTLSISPEILWIPLGSSAEVEIRGGSGAYDLDVRPADHTGLSLEVTDRSEGPQVGTGKIRFRGTERGRGSVWVQDRFLNREIPLQVQVIESQHYPSERIGKGQRESKVARLPDLDGDGVDEVILGLGEVDVGDVESGAVYIYYSRDKTLAQRLSTGERQARFGRSVAVGDWNADGINDLAVGAYTSDQGSTDSGGVFLYRGLEDGSFEEEPSQILSGQRGSDQLGISVAFCDFNGDGDLDIAAGAWTAEIPNNNSNTQGLIYVFLGSNGTYFPEPDQMIAGKSLEGTEWVDTTNVRLGTYLSAGDIDQDGLCDLVASSHYSNGPFNRNEDGEVFIYKGMAPTELSFGGVSTLPNIALTGIRDDGPNARFGWRTALANLDEDASLELVVSQPRSHNGGLDHGSVYVFQVDEIPDEPSTSYVMTDSASQVFHGQGNYNYFGWGMSLGDVNGDGLIDLGVGALNGDAPGLGNSGVVRVFLNEGTQFTETPSWTATGISPSINFGESLLIAGEGELFGFASFDSTLGVNVGRPYWLSQSPMDHPEGGSEMGGTEAGGGEGGGLDAGTQAGEDLTPPPPTNVALDMPGDIGGGHFGFSLDLSRDLNNDGRIDLLVGAPYLIPEDRPYIRTGRAFLFTQSSVDAEISLNPTMAIGSFPEHSSYDHLGEKVQAIGDFNGDSYEDFAVISRYDEQPQNYPNTFLRDSTCPARASSTGAIYIFLGQPTGVHGQIPSFAIYGLRGDDQLNQIAGGVDVNRDGLHDIIVSSRYANPNGLNDAGRAQVVHGRSGPTAGMTQVICTPNFELLGQQASRRLGWSVTSVPDINGDGCDEFAVGEPEVTINGNSRQGAVHIIFGWGVIGCYSTPQIVSVTISNRESRFGTSIAASDFDGDGITDLAVGGFNALISSTRPGAVWILRGVDIRTYTPVNPNTRIYRDFSSHVGQEGEWWLGGDENQDRFGWQVSGHQNMLLVSAPFKTYLGQVRAGVTRLYQVTANGINTAPKGLFASENLYDNLQMGDQISLGADESGMCHVGVGSFWGHGNYNGGGAVYVGQFELSSID